MQHPETQFKGKLGTLNLLAPLLLLPPAILAVAIAEVLQIPWTQISMARSAVLPFLQAISMIIPCVESFFFEIIFLLALLSISIAALNRYRKPLLKYVVILVFSGIVVLLLYRVLIQYPRFQGYPPFLASAGVLWLYQLSTNILWISNRKSKIATVLLGVTSAIGFVGFTVCTYLNYTQFQNYYQPLHQTLVGVSFVLFHGALVTLYSMIGDRFGHPARWLMGSVGTIIIFIGITVVDFVVPMEKELLPYVARYTVLGDRSHRLMHRDMVRTDVSSYIEPKCATHPTEFSEAQALEVFEKHSHFPKLPNNFNTEEFNVLLITIESMRYDSDLFDDRGNSLLPAMNSLMKDGAYWFTNALSPTNGTQHAISSLMSMTFPSFSETVVKTPDWCGTLQDDATTVAELFQQSNYATFMAIHTTGPGKDQCFGGFKQGFETSLFHEDLTKQVEKTDQLDMAIARTGISMIERFSKQNKKFFGWLFFVAPHDPYKAHKPGNWSPHERYLQEVAYADERLGSILDALKQAGQKDKTIVIVTGDHGEEFQEHRGHFHNSSLYSEQYRVPLIIKIPTVPGQAITDRTSTLYVFPWLLERGSPKMRETAVMRLCEDITPAMVLTDGAIITEFIATRGMGLSLYHNEFKLNYHLNFGLVEFFNLKIDPGERMNLYELKPRQMFPIIQFADNYLQFRGCKHKYKFQNKAAAPTVYIR